jgi:outer membrane protein assembly factor BamE
MNKLAIGLLSVSALLSLLPGCRSWNIPYRIDVEQGNVIEQEQLDQLRPGMTKRQVAFLLGSPLLEDPFHPNRWDYFHSLETGTGTRWETKLALFFDDAGQLQRIAGDMRPGAEAPPESLAMEEHKRFTHRLEKKRGPIGAAFAWIAGLFTDDEESSDKGAPDSTVGAAQLDDQAAGDRGVPDQAVEDRPEGDLNGEEGADAAGDGGILSL